MKADEKEKMPKRSRLLILSFMIAILPVFSKDRVEDVLSVIASEASVSRQTSTSPTALKVNKTRSEKKVIDPRVSAALRDNAFNRIDLKKGYDGLSVGITGVISDADQSEADFLDDLQDEYMEAINAVAGGDNSDRTLSAMIDLTGAVNAMQTSVGNVLNQMSSTSSSHSNGGDALDNIINFTARMSGDYGTGQKSQFKYDYGGNGAGRNLTLRALPFIGNDWGRITSGFGYREKYKRMHKGIDIAMSVGDSVRAVMPGVVDRVNFERNGYGCYVVVKHAEGFETRYAHLSRCIVNPGDSLTAMQPIALSGNTGNSTGPHLHFEIRQNGIAIDPMSMFSFGSGVSSDYTSPKAMENLADPLQYVVENRVTTGFNGSKKQLTTKRTYIVREGDTLQGIAARAGISLLELMKRNFISEGQNIPVGTMLRLR